MFSAQLAEGLTRRRHDVLALVAEPELRAITDAEVYTLAGRQGRRVATENVKDFRALVAAGDGPGVLFTSSRSFPRSRRNPGPLLAALDAWLSDSAVRPVEAWLLTPPR